MLSPELPLQAVSEELESKSQAYECELLPVASIDLTASRGLRSRRTWADQKDSDASDSDGEQDEQSESSTGLPRDRESLESRSNSSTSKKDNAEANLETEVMSPSCPAVTGMDLMEAKGVIKCDVSSLVPFPKMPSDESAEPASHLIQLLCRICSLNTGMSVVPCMGEDVGTDDDHEVFWCNVQPQRDGDARITPCTDATTCGIDTDANGAPLVSSLEVVGAPERPGTDAFAPTWIYGSRWPFCVAPTTLVLCNLPADLLQEDLIEILDKEGFSGFYDFLYLASDSTGKNSGNAIVNLTRHEYGLALSALMQGRTSWCGTKSEECQVSWSMPTQGLTALVDHFQELGCSESPVPLDQRPTFFSAGFPSTFPLSQTGHEECLYMMADGCYGC